MRSDAKARIAGMRSEADIFAALNSEIERLRIGHERYETVRQLNLAQFRAALELNRRTGKPFDEIIDDLRPFVRPKHSQY